MQWVAKQKGFTIVELLIVVVVIAILAAITIVAYNGITQRAKESVAKNAVSQAQKKLGVYYFDNNETYPSDITALGLDVSGNTKYQFTPNNNTSPRGYCVTVTLDGIAYRLGNNFTNPDNANVSVNDSQTTAGVCPGHTTTGVPAMTNHATNPSMEASTPTYTGPNSSTAAFSTVRARTGARSLMVSMPVTSGYSQVGVTAFRDSNVGTILQGDTDYVASVYIYIPSASPSMELSIQGSGRNSAASNSERQTATKDQWVRLWRPFKTNANGSGSLTVYILNAQPTSGSTQIWIDDIMVHKGASVSGHADGNSPDWTWNGTANSASSTGPAF